MISIYSENNTNYENNGDATLVPIKCDLELNINGSWQLSLEHPYDEEERYKYIVEGAVIQADVLCVEELTVTKQRFRIYNYSKNLHSVSAIAFPIAMESTYDAPVDNVVFDNQSGTQVFAKLQEYSNKYTFSTNISARKSASYSNTNVNEIIAGNEGFIETWGGEIVYDNLNYKVLAEIGDEDAGFRIEYGKNLTDIEYEVDDSGLATRLYPISNDKIRLNGNGYVESARVSDYPVAHSRFIDTPYTLIDDDLLSPSRTAQQTRASQSAISTSADTTSHSAYATALEGGYQPDYIKYIKSDIISAIITMSLSGIVSEKFYNLASKTITDAMAWLGNLEQPAWEWITRKGWYYGTNNADGSMKNYAINQYIYSYSKGKWYHFAESGLMDYDQSQMSQETIDLYNTYAWHQDDTGWYYGDGVSGSGNFFRNCWVENSDGTHDWVGDDGYSVPERRDTEAWAWTQLDGWMYGESLTRYAKNEYVEIDKYLEYFGSDGYWHDWERVKADEMGWYQVNDATSPHNGKWWYGSKGRNYAHNEFVYVKVDGQWKEWWYDEEGWYDESSSGDSSYDWHGDATSGYWFGEEDASTEDKSKYLHDCWAYIDDGTSEFGTYYWFNSNGYISGDATLAKRDWAWGDITDEVTGKHWFGNRDKSFNRIWISNQWLEIDGEWYYFDENGYVVSENTSKANAIAVFTSGMAALTTTVNAEKTNLYNLLYDLMTEYCEKCYAEGMDLPAITISVNLADLSNTVEYADFADLEKVKLGDSVLVIDAERNIEYTSRVVGLTYDCINQYNANVVIGKPSASIQQIVGNASGTPVSAGGIDTTALEAQLSTKVSDVRYKGSSLVNNGVAVLDNVGTKVVANPEGTPTADLTKLRVEDEIYSIPQGGGGGGNVVDMGETEYAGITPEEDTAYFVYGDGESRLDENYNYYTYNGQTGQIIVRVYHEGQSDEEIVWFFHGYSQPAGDMAIPSNLLPYYKVTTNQNAFSYLTGTTTRNGYVIIWRDKTIAVTYVSTSSYSTDVVDAVIVMGSGVNQDNPYTSPYVNVVSDLKSRYIYFNNKEYANKLKAYSTTPKVVAKDTDGNNIYEVYYEYQGEAGTTNFVVVDNLPIPSGKTLADLKIVSSKVTYLPANTNTWYEGNFYGTSNYYYYYYIQRSSDTYGKKYTLTIRTTKGSSQSNPTNLIAIIRYKF